MTATSWHSLLVVASSRIDAMAGSEIQRSLSTAVGTAGATGATGALGKGGGVAAASSDIGGMVRPASGRMASPASVIGARTGPGCGGGVVTLAAFFQRRNAQ